ncbi:hypothetical protein KO493_04175 [Tamlana agarivorans]|uniref:Uncharacterized protein n=1 Tax=Pseudotamlana agarivorans TaxID=481183 RepID=A0ACC5U6I1_9FLAO|nr:hypothetical protein [Tamlana agarivorans]MBU2949891.1 hypothetical protein [Tamlana agarivorans]
MQTFYKKLSSVIIFYMICFNVIQAQNDVILKMDGKEMIGKVIKINPSNLEFTYQNETVEYIIDLTDIAKITFSSGRVEFFNAKDIKSKAKLENHHNKVAILPFGYIRGQETNNVQMSKEIQNETYSLFKKKAVNLKFQDPNTTNTLLIKAGVNNNNLQGYTMGEICNILNVEYIVQGLVLIEKSSVSSFSNSTSKSKNNDVYIDRKGHIVGDIMNDNERTANRSTYSSSTQHYSTNLTMNIYNDKGDNLYTKDHRSFWQTLDAYKITLDYLVQKTPIYKK